MKREDLFSSLNQQFDVLVVGGGATGLGVALDAATRGYRTALVEAGDFAQATSSRATKLVHGGVRYLASGQFNLVYEALHERAVMQRNAPHLVHAQPFILPTYTRHELPYYAAGLMLYDLISGKATMGPTRVLGAKATIEKIPNIAMGKLSGSILYHDGQFNDARLAMVVAKTAMEHGAVILNYVRCARLEYSNGKVAGATVADTETGVEYRVSAKVVINATGIFSDELRRLDDADRAPLLTVSRGTHIVVGPELLGGSAGIMVPKTPDGRVIFAIPWQGRVVIGTTDIPATKPLMEPGHIEAEIDYLLETINPYLAREIERKDILSVFSGLRPLVASDAGATSKISREHHIDISKHGLVTIAGGKWTTYRRMAEDTLNFVSKQGMLDLRPCITRTVSLHGASEDFKVDDPYLREYGSDVAYIDEFIKEEPSLAERIDAALPYTFAEVVFALRHEMARTLEDVLSRRTRALLLDSYASLRAAPKVAAVIGRELDKDQSWVDGQIKSYEALVRADYSCSDMGGQGS